MVNLPTVNTPEFRWIRSHMPRKAKPFGTIFAPEVAAQAIVWASEHPRRELNVGWGTTQAIIANAFAPGVMIDVVMSDVECPVIAVSHWRVCSRATETVAFHLG